VVAKWHPVTVVENSGNQPRRCSLGTEMLCFWSAAQLKVVSTPICTFGRPERKTAQKTSRRSVKEWPRFNRGHSRALLLVHRVFFQFVDQRFGRTPPLMCSATSSWENGMGA